MIGKCSNCDNQGSPFGKVHEKFEDRPIDELLCVFCGDEAIKKEKIMIAINGPMEGKFYRTSDITHTVIDHVRNSYNIFELRYYRTKNGWAFHSWKRLY